MGLNFTTLTISIIVVSMFALAIGSFMVDIGSRYGVSVNQSYTHTYDKMQKISNISNQVSQQVIGDEATSSSQGEALFQQGQSAMMLSFRGTELIGAMGQDATEEIGIPWWFTGGVIAIIIVILGFLLFGVLLRAFQKL